jgi:hypothetical protein
MLASGANLCANYDGHLGESTDGEPSIAAGANEAPGGLVPSATGDAETAENIGLSKTFRNAAVS